MVPSRLCKKTARLSFLQGFKTKNKQSGLLIIFIMSCLYLLHRKTLSLSISSTHSFSLSRHVSIYISVNQVTRGEEIYIKFQGFHFFFLFVSDLSFLPSLVFLSFFFWVCGCRCKFRKVLEIVPQTFSHHTAASSPVWMKKVFSDCSFSKML